MIQRSDRSRHRNHGPVGRERRPHHRTRLRRAVQPQAHRQRPAHLLQPRAREPRGRAQGARPDHRFPARQAEVRARSRNDVVEYLRGAELIIHNAAFDVGFLNKELELAGLPPLHSFVGEVTDTLAMAKQVYPGQAQLARCAVRPLRRRPLEPHLPRRQARRATAGRRLHQPHARPGCAADRRGVERARAAARVVAIDLRQLRAAGADRDRARTRRARGRVAATRQVQQRPDAFSPDSRKSCGIIAGFACTVRRNPTVPAITRLHSVPIRAVSSGVEHSIHTAGVGGSKPPPPTKFTSFVRAHAPVGPAPTSGVTPARHARPNGFKLPCIEGDSSWSPFPDLATRPPRRTRPTCPVEPDEGPRRAHARSIRARRAAKGRSAPHHARV